MSFLRDSQIEFLGKQSAQCTYYKW